MRLDNQVDANPGAFLLRAGPVAEGVFEQRQQQQRRNGDPGQRPGAVERYLTRGPRRNASRPR